MEQEGAHACFLVPTRKSSASPVFQLDAQPHGPLHHSLTTVPHPAWPLSHCSDPQEDSSRRCHSMWNLHTAPMPALPGSWQHQGNAREPTKVQKGAGGAQPGHVSVPSNLPYPREHRAHKAWSPLVPTKASSLPPVTCTGQSLPFPPPSQHRDSHFQPRQASN